MDNQNDKIMYALLEITYEKKIKLKNNGELDKEKIFPKDWYVYTAKKRIEILDEAISKEILVKDTESYKNIYPEGTITINR